MGIINIAQQRRAFIENDSNKEKYRTDKNSIISSKNTSTAEGTSGLLSYLLYLGQLSHTSLLRSLPIQIMKNTDTDSTTALWSL